MRRSTIGSIFSLLLTSIACGHVDDVEDADNPDQGILTPEELITYGESDASKPEEPEPLAKILTESQVAHYVRKAGFPENLVGTMVCIAKYESSFRPRALLVNSRGTQYLGLFQLSDKYWLSRCGATRKDLLTPEPNAICALTVLESQGLGAWSTYRKHRAECDNYPAPL